MGVRRQIFLRHPGASEVRRLVHRSSLWRNDFVMCSSIQYILLSCIHTYLKFAKGSLVTFKSIITRQSQLNNNQASFTDRDWGNTIVSPCVWHGRTKCCSCLEPEKHSRMERLGGRFPLPLQAWCFFVLRFCFLGLFLFVCLLFC